MWPRAQGVVLALLLGGCAAREVAVGTVAVAPGRPGACREVSTQDDLARLLRDARPGDALCLSPGRHRGQVQVPAHVTLWGPRAAQLDGAGTGTTVRLTDGARLLGLTVEGSGARYDTLDAAVHVTGEGVTVEGVRVVNALFGILVEQARGPRLINNEVSGRTELPPGMRGDGIRLWETTGALIEGNRVERSRDCVVWYSSGNTFRSNTMREGRYGAHFMFSHDNVVEDNTFSGNEVGVFVMYSRGVVVRRNRVVDSAGAAGMGLGVKESGDLTVERNLLRNNTVGVYLDSSPLQNDEHNVFTSNLVELSQSAVVFHSSPERNAFFGNSFRGNETQVAVEGGGDALGITWEGNDFDDYQGYDLDRDGVGDVPYQQHSLSEDLVSHHPALSFFQGAPVLALVRAAGHVAPLLAPKPVLSDPKPRQLRRADLGVPRAH